MSWLTLLSSRLELTFVEPRRSYLIGFRMLIFTFRLMLSSISTNVLLFLIFKGDLPEGLTSPSFFGLPRSDETEMDPLLLTGD